MILVAGATGALGGSICRRLAEDCRAVRGLVRKSGDPGKLLALESEGISIAEGHIGRRRTLESACRGMRTVVSTMTSLRSRQPDDTIESVDLNGQLALIDAAEAAGVQHFIFISCPQQQIQHPLQDAKRTVEQRLAAGRMAFTVVRPAFFMETWLGSLLWPHAGLSIVERRAVIFGSGERKSHWISVEDVARVVVRCIERPPTRGRLLDIGGPEALSVLEGLSVLQDVLGARFEVRHVSEEQLRLELSQAENPLRRSMLAMMLVSALGCTVPTNAPSELVPLQLRTVRGYAEDVRCMGGFRSPFMTT